MFLKKLDFVRWDRYIKTVENGQKLLKLYGWIDREKDKYKDFIVLDYFPQKRSFKSITSSSRMTDQINNILYPGREGHVKCLRVEKDFNIPNAIKLKP